jgi:ribosome-associated protein
MSPGACYLEHVSSAGTLAARKKEDNVLSLDLDAARTAKPEAPMNVAPAQTPAKDVTSEDLLARIVASLTDDKAEDIVQIDLRGKTAFGDYMVICSGRSSRQVAGIADKLAKRLKQDLGRVARTEGKDAGDWVLIDTGDVVVHIFRPEVREFYQLEKMWLPAVAGKTG